MPMGPRQPLSRMMRSSADPARPGRAGRSSAFLVAVAGHAVEVQRHQVGLHLREQFGKAVQVIVPVVQVVDDADVGDALGLATSR